MQKGNTVLGIEGTAWNLSAAVFGDGLISLYSKPYQPAQGGIHPREAAQHHASEMREVIARVLTAPDEIEAVAFSQGPGLGPCLRTVATAARALALALDVPLVGVNHCVAHVEIGRWATGCVDPITLYTSGANTQVLGYLNGRYRIFGETLDIGLGNGLDKFARSKGFPHPGGPKIEALARGGNYIDLPYTVKGMDLAFSGLISAAQESTAPIEDVCHSLQETAFAMCVEVTERALAQAGKDEVLLVGGVAANTRLREMLRTMCEERGARLFVPEPQFCGDNGAMIAYTGRIMLEAGATLPVEASRANSHYRADEVAVVWRHDDEREVATAGPRRGAEAVVTIGDETVAKNRVSKSYRSEALDARLIAERTRAEARLIAAARKVGVATPIVLDVSGDTITMERVEGVLLRDAPTPGHLELAGVAVGRLHGAGIVHGDLSTSNMIERDGRCVLIDFGLAHASAEVEDQGVDLHVLFQILESTTENPTELKEHFMRGYAAAFPGAAAAAKREHEVELRGRYL